MAKQTKKAVGRRLGRGLGSLIGSPVAIDSPQDEPATDVTEQTQAVTPGSTPAAAPASSTLVASAGAAQGDGIQHLSLSSIVANTHQPRQNFADEPLAQLAESIRTTGLMQPIVVRPRKGGFELVAGERRWRAFQLLERGTIPAIVREVDDKAAAEWALVENLQREDLAPLERADGIARLMDDFGLTQSDAGKQLSMDRATISNLLRLREADEDTRAALAEGLIMQGHARALLGCTDLDRRKKLLGRCVREGWSVREVERRVQQAPPTGAGSTETRSSHVADLEEKLGAHLGTKVRINLGRKKGTGKLSLDFYSLEQFDGLLDKLGFVPPSD